VTLSVAQNVLGLDVSVADSLCVYVGNRAQQLVAVQLYYQIWNHLLHFEVVLHHAVGSVLNVVHHHIQVHLVGLFSIGVKGLAHLHAIRVVQHFQYLQLTIFVPFILKHLLYRYSLTSLSDCGFEHNTKRAITNNFFGIISE